MQVLLVHGLGRTPLSMARLARHVRRAGGTPTLFGYAAWASPYATIRDRLAARVRATDASGAPWIAVGHSLGGLLLRDAIGAAHPTALAHLVMLATPNRPPRLARRAVRYAPFRWMAGECGMRLASPDWFASLSAPAIPHTLFAGTRGITGRWSPFGGEPNDGIVALDEVPLPGGGAPRLVRATHTFIMDHADVREAIAALLAAPADCPPPA